LAIGWLARGSTEIKSAANAVDPPFRKAQRPTPSHPPSLSAHESARRLSGGMRNSSATWLSPEFELHAK
jgi:hypothetical protein